MGSSEETLAVWSAVFLVVGIGLVILFYGT